MALFDSASMAAIDAVAAKSKQKLATKPAISNSTVDKIASMEETVREYFKDSEAILITSKEQLHEYIDGCIDAGYAGIDTETTGLDKVSDTIVGSSLYYPGGVECYIPNFHKVPIMENYRSNQLSYAECQEEFQRLVDNKVKCIFANADYDIAMLYKDYKVDFIPACYYDVILAWRVIKENEPHNGLKQLYSKYVLKGEGDPKKFSDFFDAKTFPYCKPDVAKLYAANDARITYELFLWQLPYVTKTNPKCISHHLEHIADIVWGIEIPMIKACAELHRTGMYIEKDVASYITKRYNEYYEKELATMRDMVQKLIDEMDIPNNSARPFKTGADFNPDSVVHTKYLLYTLMQVPVPTVGKNKGKKPTGKEVVGEINMPEAKQLLKVRSLSTLIGTFTEKLPNSVASDNRIHASFKSIGAATGRMCIAKGTRITVLNGYKNIEDIVPGDLVYCYDADGNLVFGKVKNLWLTGKNKDCVKIKWQSSGTHDTGELICTPEHLILKKTGEWCRADALKRYDKLAHLRRTVRKPEFRPRLFGWNGISTREQDIIKSCIFNAAPNMIIHHKDGNPTNNDLSNLEIMTASEHSRYHAELAVQARDVAASIRTPEAHATISRNHTVSSVRPCGKYDVYDIEVEEYHNFIANEICVHNSSQSPNLQNIPSRHTDIRHMFRATPEMETDGECTIEGTMLRIELNLLSVVYLDSGEEKQVKNLVCGDLVEIRLGNKTNAPIRYFPVKSKVINEPNAYVYIGADDVSSDIHYVLRHRTPPYALIGSDYSQQEPKILGFVAKDPEMIKAFSDGKDIYSTIASIAFNVPYEECLENHPVTGEYQKEGKARRTQAKSIVLGISYGRSIPSIAEQLFGSDDTMSDDEKTKEAQKVYDSVMAAFPNLRQLMISAQATATQKGYVETILGRRRHIPDMMLPPFAFEPMAGYVNPDIDPLDPSTLHNKEVIPARIVDALTKEYSSFKYNGQRYRRNKELYEEHIKVIDNRSKINDASRECVNCVDFETEILTQDGWKSYKEVSVGDKILSYSLDKQQIVKDAVEAVHTYYGPRDVVRFESSTFSAVSTMNHRWVVGDGQKILRTEDLIFAEGRDSSILRIAKNDFESACLLSDDELKSIQLPITFDFVSLLSCHQAEVLLNHLFGFNSSLLCEDIKTADVVQYLCAVAGYASSVSEQRIGINTRYSVMIEDYSDCVDLSGCDVSYETASGVWCVTTHEGTWIARRNGTVYITGNSIIQGSASELTKMAIISLINNKDWQRFGGRFLVPVHDELIAEVPTEYAEEAGKVLTDCMVNAGSFLPFAINCDLEITYRWYGLSVNSIAYKHQKPESLDNMSEDNIKWVQAHICEMEYVLPLFNDENGDKPRGDAAHGVNGIWTQELSDSIDDYCVRFNIPKSDFISDIQQRVECGYVKPKSLSNDNKN